MTTYRQAARPTVGALVLDAIPEEMREADRWCVWRYEPHQDAKSGVLEWRKEPFQAHHISKRADSTQPRTWAPFAVAARTYQRERFAGLWFALGEGWAAIDLDHVVDVATGTIALEWETAARSFNSYVELSPSGAGVRVVLHAAETKGLSYKRDNVEAYDHAHFVSITGHHLPGTPTTVEHRQAELDGFRSIYLPAVRLREPVASHQSNSTTRHPQGWYSLTRRCWRRREQPPMAQRFANSGTVIPVSLAATRAGLIWRCLCACSSGRTGTPIVWIGSSGGADCTARNGTNGAGPRPMASVRSAKRWPGGTASGIATVRMGTRGRGQAVGERKRKGKREKTSINL